jgi:hypothetical protein
LRFDGYRKYGSHELLLTMDALKGAALTLLPFEPLALSFHCHVFASHFSSRSGWYFLIWATKALLQAPYHSGVKGFVLPQGCRLASGGTSVILFRLLMLAPLTDHRHQFNPQWE